MIGSSRMVISSPRSVLVLKLRFEVCEPLSDKLTWPGAGNWLWWVTKRRVCSYSNAVRLTKVNKWFVGQIGMDFDLVVHGLQVVLVCTHRFQLHSRSTTESFYARKISWLACFFSNFTQFQAKVGRQKFCKKYYFKSRALKRGPVGLRSKPLVWASLAQVGLSLTQSIKKAFS